MWDQASAAGYDALRSWFAADIGGLYHDVTICPGNQTAIVTAFAGWRGPAMPC